MKRQTHGETTTLRIIGGHYRGRKLAYSGDRRTRPMKDRVREALFNLLGPDVKGCHAIDLFAGTGALGLEAISRGAVGATFVEQHYPTAALIDQNIATLELGDVTSVVTSDTFFWSRRNLELPACRWVVLCAPPYDFYVDRQEEMLELLTTLVDRAPDGSLLAVEADRRFDFSTLPAPDSWYVREYAPAVLGVRCIDRGIADAPTP